MDVTQTLSPQYRQCLSDRRHALQTQFPHPVILWSGSAPPRNFAANTYPFRASSHFLYFAGIPLENAALRLADGTVELYWDEPPVSAALWESLPPSREALAETIAATAHYPLEELLHRSVRAATLPSLDLRTARHQTQVLNRAVGLDQPLDRTLAEAIVSCRLTHDAFGVEQIQHALTVTIAAHATGMTQTPSAQQESEICAAMEGVILAQHCAPAYGSIVTTHGEILHNHHYRHPLGSGDLVLADVGAESPLGWASDLTRTWPVSGQFTPSQRDLYTVVLQAHDACIAALRPGVEYRDIHLLGCQVLTQGLVDLGILKGAVEDLVAEDVHALFFPHGIGHLLGLDVHDMEDLGDLAGYAPGRQRSDRFGLCYLRLDRPLQENMVVTIEPGFYQVPSILQPAQSEQRYRDWVNWNRLENFADVRGIRIEDDVRITATGSEVLSAALPTAIEAIETLAQGKTALDCKKMGGLQ